MAKVSIGDLNSAANWLETLEVNDESDPADVEYFEGLQRVVKFLDAEIAKRQKISRLAERKRAYAAEHGIPVSQVRVTKKAGA